MTDSISDTLLSQILTLVQEIHVSLDGFNNRLASLEVKVDTVIADGFPDSDPASHKAWHIKHKYSGIRRFLLKILS